MRCGAGGIRGDEELTLRRRHLIHAVQYLTACVSRIRHQFGHVDSPVRRPVGAVVAGEARGEFRCGIGLERVEGGARSRVRIDCAIGVDRERGLERERQPCVWLPIRQHDEARAEQPSLAGRKLEDHVGEAVDGIGIAVHAAGWEDSEERVRELDAELRGWVHLDFREAQCRRRQLLREESDGHTVEILPERAEIDGVEAEHDWLEWRDRRHLFLADVLDRFRLFGKPRFQRADERVAGFGALVLDRA